MEFKRENFVKDLFDSNMILEQFNQIYYNNVSSFVNALSNNFISLINREKISHKIFVDSKKDFEILYGILNSLNEKVYINNIFVFIIRENALKENIFNEIEEFKFGLTFFVESFDIHRYKESLDNIYKSDWGKNIKISTRYIISYENYSKVCEFAVELFYKYSMVRYIDIAVDYFSFEKMTLEEYHKVYFNFKNLLLSNNILYHKTSNHFKSIYVDMFKLYESQTAFIDSEEILDLEDKIDKNGEEIEFRTLNVYRKYLDINSKSIHSNILDMNRINYYLIDYYQSKKIDGLYNSVPTITKMFMEIFNG